MRRIRTRYRLVVEEDDVALGDRRVVHHRTARHGDVDAVLAIIKREQISRFGFVGNEAYENLF